MRKKLYFLLISAIILGIFSSCKTKQAPVPNSNEAQRQLERTSEYSDSQSPIYSLPEAPITPLPDTAPAAPPTNEPVKSTVPELLGSYQTPLLDRHKERLDNINLAVRKISGYKLKSGETFSFNGVVGKRDSNNGFKTAPVIVKGEHSEDIGGGVCQVSSTLYNAAIKAGLQVLERHPHSIQVAYVPKGKDAAVSFGYLDLKIKNTKEYTVEVRAAVEGTQLKTYIYKVK